MAIKRGTGRGRGKGKRSGHSRSGYLQTGRAYFPSDAPVYFSYTDAFTTDHNGNRGFKTVGDIVQTKLNGEKYQFHKDAWSNPAIIEQLEAIRAAAEKEEAAFIAKYQLDIGNGSWGEIIKAFTILFSSEAAFMRNLQLLKQVSDKNSNTNIYHHFTAYLSSYVQTAARDIIWENKTQLLHNNLTTLLPKLNDQIIEKALKDMFSMTDLVLKNGYIETNTGKQKQLEGTEIQAYKDLLSKIKLFMTTPFKNFINDRLGLTEEFLQETLNVYSQRYHRNDKKGGSLPLLKSTITNGNLRGSAEELFEAVFASEVGKQLDGIAISNGFFKVDFKTFNTGVKGVKPDTTMYNLTAKGGVPNIQERMSTVGDDRSNRVNAINNAEQLFRDLKNAEGEIIFISDKNYQIKTNDFDGFMAQGNIKLRNLEALLNKVHYPGDFQALVNYLANCGQNMLLGVGNTREILSGVATQIGHFLFDDLTITSAANGLPSGVTRVHLLNLSGFYVPLSIYMGGLLDSVRNAEAAMKSAAAGGFVNTVFVGKGNVHVSPGWPKGRGDFNKFRDTRVDQSYLEIHFMRNFMSFMGKQFGF